MKTTLVHRIQAHGLSAYAGLVWRTARYQIEGQEHVDGAHASGRPIIIAAWHGMTMMLSRYVAVCEDPSQYVMIVPADARGATLSAWARWMGATPFTISMESDSLAAAHRLLTLIRQMKQGKNLCLNPDGPDGPSHEPKMGVAFIARASKALIVPAGAFTSTGYRIPRWDRYTVPFPFSRIAVVLGEPLDVSQEASRESAVQAIKTRLNRMESAAERLYRRGPNGP